MKYFKDESGQLFGFEDDYNDISENLTELSEIEVSDLLHPPILLVNFIQTALEEVDTKAEIARKRYITSGEGQIMVYQQKVTEAEKYTASTTPVDTDYPLLKAESDAMNMTVSETAKLVLTTRDQWLVIAAQIESTRFGAKVAIKSAVSVTAVQTILDSLIWP